MLVYNSSAFVHSSATKDALVDIHVSICRHAAYHHVYWTAAVVDPINYRCIVGRRVQAQRHHAI